MPSPVDLPGLSPGARVQEAFLVLDVEARTTADGNSYTVLVLGNSTGRIPTEPFWLDRQDQIAGIRRGQAVQVIGEVTTYRDRRQLKTVSVRLLPDGLADPAALLPSVGAVDRYWATLDGWGRDLREPRPP